MAINVGPSKRFGTKTTLKFKKKLPGGGKLKIKKTTFSHPRDSGGGTRMGGMGKGGGGLGSIRTGQVGNPMTSRLNADIGFDY